MIRCWAPNGYDLMNWPQGQGFVCAADHEPTTEQGRINQRNARRLNVQKLTQIMRDRKTRLEELEALVAAHGLGTTLLANPTRRPNLEPEDLKAIQRTIADWRAIGQRNAAAIAKLYDANDDQNPNGVKSCDADDPHLP